MIYRREAPNAFTMTTDEDEGKLRFHMNALKYDSVNDSLTNTHDCMISPNALGTPRKHAGSNAPTPKVRPPGWL